MNNYLKPCPLCGSDAERKLGKVWCSRQDCTAWDDCEQWNNFWANKIINEQAKLLETCYDALLETNHEHISYQANKCPYCDLIGKIKLMDRKSVGVNNANNK